MIKEGLLKQLVMWTAHKTEVKSIQFINIGSEDLVMTASADQMVHLWTFQGVLRGSLKQGKENTKDYLWDFKLNNLEDIVQEKKQTLNSTLTNLRSKRDNEMSIKKREEINTIKNRPNGIFQLAGSQLLGMKPNMVIQVAQEEYEDNTEYGKRHKKFNDVIARGKKYIEITNRVQN